MHEIHQSFFLNRLFRSYVKITLMLCLFVLLILTSCGYRFGKGELIQKYHSICIPYVEGDDQGYLTTALVRNMITNGALAYRSYGADLVLKVCLQEPVDTNIGFQYAPKKEEEFGYSNIVVSNEARLTMTATIRLIDRHTGDCVLGPCDITAALTYDFEPDLTNVSYHKFSLGQLEMHNLARDAATPPLYSLLADKIVDYVNHGW